MCIDGIDSVYQCIDGIDRKGGREFKVYNSEGGGLTSFRIFDKIVPPTFYWNKNETIF